MAQTLNAQSGENLEIQIGNGSIDRLREVFGGINVRLLTKDISLNLRGIGSRISKCLLEITNAAVYLVEHVTCQMFKCNPRTLSTMLMHCYWLFNINF